MKGLRGVLEKKIDRQELSKGDMRKVESWEEVLDGALKMIEVRLLPLIALERTAN